MIQAPKQESRVYELVPAGNHLARVYRVLHIGTVPENFQGEQQEINKVMIGFD